MESFGEFPEIKLVVAVISLLRGQCQANILLFALFFNTGCHWTILLRTMTSWKFATWVQTVPKVLEMLITGKGVLRKVPGLEVHLLGVAVTSSILLP